jgi:hypothetical protein
LSRLSDHLYIPANIINRFEKFHSLNTRDNGTNKLVDGNHACSYAQELKAMTTIGFGLVRNSDKAYTNYQNNKSHFVECREYYSLSRSYSGCL